MVAAERASLTYVVIHAASRCATLLTKFTSVFSTFFCATTTPNIIFHQERCLQRARHICGKRWFDKRNRARGSKYMPRGALPASPAEVKARTAWGSRRSKFLPLSAGNSNSSSRSVYAVRNGFAATVYAAATVTAAVYEPAVLAAAIEAAVFAEATPRAAGALRATSSSPTALAVCSISAAPNAAAVVTATKTATANIAMGLRIWEQWNQSSLPSA